ncbi:organic cation transporter protein isoform X1 [Pectinophora gossypiella]|uniref:organic cation transporter protein isoform X1 n=1 Tax=Pectinophora gossypiella TaxID=13191 RepID=UPI00214EBFD5|nr:organic cation transporter protein isoform X1 [Pectinophora gossypiella]XP_049872476.1 organic cation transporter protein isoform X1 [Pectinophora gossypiella]
MDKDHALEEMMGKLGDFGRYQCFQFILHILAAMTAGMHMLSLVTVAAVPDHRCWVDGVDTNESIAAWNASEILAAIPEVAPGMVHNCLMFTESNETATCSKWVYDTTYRSSSRAMEWDLVCEKRWMGAIAQTVYMLGVFTGAVVLGGMADKYGRKTIFCWSGVLQLILGVVVAFIPEYWTFLVIRFLYGIFGSAGSYITGFVLTMELVGPSKRTACGVAFQAAFAGGIMLVAAWGAIVDNNQYLQMIYGLHSILLIPHIWIMDESPRWLWAQGRAKESVDIVEKALKCNKSEHTLDRAQLVSRGKVEATKGTEEPVSSAGTLDLFKTPNLRNKTLNVCLCWFANSIAYYGLTLSTGRLEGNPYLVIAIMGFVEFPSYAAVIYFLDVWGRRPLISSMMLVGGAACIIATFLPPGSIFSTAVVITGKLFIAGSFAIIYNYSAELFPTVVRNSAMGLGSMCARLSGALTPLITLLDSFNPKIPAVIFGVVTLISGFLCFFLPETMNQPMPQSLADGEKFGKGDTCFTSCLGKNGNNKTYAAEDKTADVMVPLEDMSKKG